MATIDQVEMGIANYLDKEVFSQYEENSITKVGMQVAAALVIRKKKTDAVNALSAIGLIDKDGTVDAKLFCDTLKTYIPESGMVYENKLIGKLIFQKEDVDRLYSYIEGGRTV